MTLINVEFLFAILIGLIQGLVFLPFVQIVPELVTERWFEKYKKNHLRFLSSVTYVIGMIFIILLFFTIGKVLIDLIANESNQAQVISYWGKSWFFGLVSSMIIGVIEEEIRKKRKE